MRFQWGMALVFGLLIPFSPWTASADALSKTAATSSSPLGDVNLDAVLRVLRSSLDSMHMTGRIDYRAECQSGPEYDKVLFPPLKIHAATAGQSSKPDYFQKMFRGNADVVVTRPSPGIIKITFGRISEALLRTKISNLTLDPDGQFNPNSAFGALRNNEDVKASMKTLEIRPAKVIFIGGVNPPSSSLPHLPPVIRDKTFGQVLDAISQAFNGVVIYGACTHPHVFELFFVPLRDGPPVMPSGTRIPK